VSPRSDNARYLVPGLVRGIQILRLFNAERTTITAPEMARELGIPRSTVFRIAQTLEHLQLLSRAPGGIGYALGIGVLAMGFEYLASLDLTDVARGPLEALRDTTGCSAHLVVRDGPDVVVIMKVPGHSAFSGSLNIGTRLPAHGTVLGRVILADLPASELRELYGTRQLPCYSEQTPRNVPALLEMLAQDRARGYALSSSFFESGISAVAFPVRDHTGEVLAAVNITVPGDGEIAAQKIEAVRDAANSISQHLNFQPLGEAAQV